MPTDPPDYGHNPGTRRPSPTDGAVVSPSSAERSSGVALSKASLEKAAGQPESEPPPRTRSTAPASRTETPYRVST